MNTINVWQALPVGLVIAVIVIVGILGFLLPLFVVAIHSTLKRIEKQNQEMSQNMELMAKNLAVFRTGGVKRLDDQDLK